MEIALLSAAQRVAIGKAFAYWVRHWDWEMRTLTGLTEEEFRRAAEAWGAGQYASSHSLALAALGAVRECWSQAKEATEVLGLSRQETCLLMELLAKEIDNAA